MTKLYPSDAHDMRLDRANPEQQHATEEELSAARRVLRKEPSPRRLENRRQPVIARLSADEHPAPLSFAQERLWFIHQVDPNITAYHVPVGWRLIGELNVAALERAVSEIVQRHDVLRTTFRMRNGAPIQVVAPAEAIRLTVEEVTEDDAEEGVQRRWRDEMEQRFDLEQGSLLRLLLLRLAQNEHVLLIVMHHIVTDGWSLAVLHDELSKLYASFVAGEGSPLSPLQVQYADYAVWQRELLRGERLNRLVEFWKSQMDGAPALLELPTDRPRPAVATHRGGRERVELTEELSRKLKSLSRQEGATLFMTLLAGFQVLLSRYSGQTDVVVGTSIAGRTQAETEPLIGMFVNTLALRADLRDNPSFKTLLAQTRKRLLGAYAHQEMPFERLVAELGVERNLSYSPVCQVMFVFQSAPKQALTFPGLELKPLTLETAESSATFEIVLSLTEGAEKITGTIAYSAELFDATTIKRLIRRYLIILERIVANPLQRVSGFNLLTKEEREQILAEWNRTTRDYPRQKGVHELFEQQAAQNPRRIALSYEEQQLTYEELNAQANQLAHYLKKLGVGPEARVGICVERSPKMVAALLGVLKAGGAYVPLDPGYPAERIAFMLKDSEVGVLLTEEPLQARLPKVAVPTICLDSLAEDLATEPVTDPTGSAGPEDLAYVMYTSGSTGAPKGVAAPHRAITRLLFGVEYVRLGPDEAILQLAPLGFDASTFEVWGALLHGGRLVLCPEQTPTLERLEQLLQRERVTCLWLTASLFNFIVDVKPEMLAGVRQILTGGEALSAPHVDRALAQLPETRLINGYGPTEGTTFTCCYRIPRPRPEEWLTVPIGGPISNTRVYILDKKGAPTPVGIYGELYIGGDGLARGYLNRPDLTAETFVPDPFSLAPGARLYRTGDLVRWRNDGTIEFAGRRDDQVKIRGFRIEPGEIESVMRQLPGVRDAAVLMRDDAHRGKHLIGYAVLEAGCEPGSIQSRLREVLPAYMVPAALVRLGSLPLTANGKVDRAALLRTSLNGAELEQMYVAPRTQMEAVLAGIWEQLLGLEQVGVHDNFFELGGHSLLAMRVVSQIRLALQVEVGVRTLFEAPTLAELASRVSVNESGDKEPMPPLVALQHESPPPLSFAQERLWFIQQLEPASTAYHIPWLLRLRGELDVEALSRSLNELSVRHQPLRTSFSLREGKPVQIILAAKEISLKVEDCSALNREEQAAVVSHALAQEAGKPFDLAQRPLLRQRLLRMGEQEHVLLIVMHHIVTDGWSLAVLHDELSKMYAAFVAGEGSPLSPLQVQYADYAVWQRELLRGERLNRLVEFWKSQMDGAPALLELPTDRPRPAVATHRGGRERVELTEELSRKLKSLSRQEGATLFMTLLAGFQVLLSRYSGQTDVVVGTSIAGRTQAETEPLIGMFFNMLPLRTDLSGAPRFRDLLGRIRETTLGAYAHQEMPFERLVAELGVERSLSYSPLFQVMFELHNAPRASLELAGLEMERLEVGGDAAKFDLTLSMFETQRGLKGAVEYSTDVFERNTIKRLIDHFARLLEAIVENPETKITELTLLNESERQQIVVEWNSTAIAYPQDECMHEMFEEQVGKTPGEVALVFEEQKLSYEELNKRANQLAHHLRKLGAGPEDRIGICVQRSVEMVIGLFGIMKAGAAYVALDPTYPMDRVKYMLEDSGAKVLLTQESLLEKMRGISNAEVVCLDTQWEAIGREPETNPIKLCGSDNLAYIYYTSGSTGRPKGVAVPHCGIVNYIRWGVEAYKAREGNGAAVHSSIAVDLTLTNFLPLFAGKHVVLVADQMGVEGLVKLIETRPELGLLKITPTHLAVLNPQLTGEQMAATARVLVIGADNLVAEPTLVWRDEASGVKLLNEYGPTETVVGCSTYEIGEETSRVGGIPIGKPIANIRMYVLDDGMRSAPIGVAGELYIGGIGVARGYWGRPALTAERFVPDPYRPEPGGRLYKTGDRARYQADGNLEFLGRMDHQVKIRGYRIEPGEIEAVLSGHEKVNKAMVVVRELTPGDKRLVAYAGVGTEAVTVKELREYLKERVPEYMVPAGFVLMEELPVGASGKIDPKALPVAEIERPETEEVAPRTQMEEVLAGIWGHVLGLEHVGVHDNFFELGGDSIVAIQAIARAAQVGIKLTPKDCFEYQTIAELAMAAEPAGSSLAEQGLVTGPVTLTPIQHWFFEESFAEPDYYNQSTLLEASENIVSSFLEKAVSRLLEHHDALRLRFERTDTGWRQFHAEPDESAPVEYVDLSNNIPDGELDQAVNGEASTRQTSLNYSRGPTLRVVLFDFGSRRRQQVLIVIHHLVVDSVSWRILIEDLETLYRQVSSAEPFELPAKTTSFQRWAEHLTEYLQLPEFHEDVAFWLDGPKTLAPIPVDGPGGPNIAASARAVSLSLSVEETRALLQDVPKAYLTQIDDVLLTALLQAFCKWTGKDTLLIALEGHGRQVLEDGIDVSRTVGWFTSAYPVNLELRGVARPNEAMGEALKAVKELLRQIRFGGIGYGLCRYSSGQSEITSRLRAQPLPK